MPLGALVAIEDLRGAVFARSLLDRLDAKAHVHANRD